MSIDARSTLIVCLEECEHYNYLVQKADNYNSLRAGGLNPVATRCCMMGYLYGIKYRASGEERDWRYRYAFLHAEKLPPGIKGGETTHLAYRKWMENEVRKKKAKAQWLGLAQQLFCEQQVSCM